MKTLIKEVLRIETATNKKGGEYKRAILEGDKKQPLFGDLEEQIPGPGKYELTYDDSSTPWQLESVKLVSGQVNSGSNGSHSQVSQKNIDASVILKAVAQVMAAQQGLNSQEFETLSGVVFNVFSKLFNEYTK